MCFEIVFLVAGATRIASYFPNCFILGSQSVMISESEAQETANGVIIFSASFDNIIVTLAWNLRNSLAIFIDSVAAIPPEIANKIWQLLSEVPFI